MLLYLADKESCAISTVLRAGKPVAELVFEKSPLRKSENSIRAAMPTATELDGPTGRVHVIGVQQGKILTAREVKNSDDPEVCHLTVLERYGRGSKPANAYASGFGRNFKGAIASSVGHDSHNLIVAGKHPSDMQVALKAISECGGGFCVVQNAQVIARLPLAFGGLMSTEGPKTVTDGLKNLRAASRAVGCELEEPFLQLAFLSLPVISSLKLTDKGLVDVEKFQFIPVNA